MCVLLACAGSDGGDVVSTAVESDEHEELAIGALAPPFALRDVFGVEHRLAAHAGQVVVLEWTSSVCPSVAAATWSGVLADTREALDPERTAWLRIDSSWYAPSLSDELRRWFAMTGSRGVPYLLDPDGAVGRAYGARATPHLFVIDREGRLAYSGGLELDASKGERARRNPVLEAVDAALAGEPAKLATTRPLGCSVKYGEPGPFAAEDVEGHDAWMAYHTARKFGYAGDVAGALDQLAIVARASDEGRVSPAIATADPGFRRLLDDPDGRKGVRALYRSNPARGRVRMTAPDEPGTPFVVAGRVVDAEGAPIAGAWVGAFHTTADGYYSERTTSSTNPRLFGAVTTDRDGRFRFRTIEPAGYATDPHPAHVHLDVTADGYASRGGVAASIYFDDDPGLRPSDRAEIATDGGVLTTRFENAEGVRACEVELALERR